MINVIEFNGYVTFNVDKSVQNIIIIVTNNDCMQVIFIKRENTGLSINLSWSFVSSLLWVIVSLIHTYLYQRRKLNPYNTINY